MSAPLGVINVCPIGCYKCLPIGYQCYNCLLHRELLISTSCYNIMSHMVLEIFVPQRITNINIRLQISSVIQYGVPWDVTNVCLIKKFCYKYQAEYCVINVVSIANYKYQYRMTNIMSHLVLQILCPLQYNTIQYNTIQ